MKDYQRKFVEFAIEQAVLGFGEYTLKSGRVSPYFFNAGLFNTGASLKRLSEFYAACILDSGESHDVLFGPAYKGITLASATAVALSDVTGEAVPFCFNRKEAKSHGEGGVTIGAELRGRVAIVDDVISAGTSINEAVEIIRAAGAEPSAVFIALDRQEKGGETGTSAVDQVAARFGIKVYAIATLSTLIAHLEQHEEMSGQLAAIRRYRDRYGAV
jgi:orotate phosphoribosyltransferase